MTVPGLRPLGYTGIKETNPPQLYFRDRDPDMVTFKDFRNYDIGDEWQNVLTGQWFKMVSKRTVNSGGVIVTEGKWAALTGASGSGDIITINGIGADPFGNFSITAGAGITITPGVNSISIAATAIPFPWQDIAVNTALAVNNGYFTNGGVQLLLTLPAVCAQGDIIEVAGKTADWQLVIPGGQSVQVFDQLAVATVTSSKPTDTIRLVCSTANTLWTTLSLGGNVIPL